MECPACQSPAAAEQRFCSSCGAALANRLAETRTGTPAATSDSTERPPGAVPSAGGAKGWLSGSGDISHGRFEPGQLVGGRYRVIGLLGRGGMGEVYRADDLRLGQPVALKFLPEELVQDARRLAQFHGEVRTARQVTHPNVCRVYDIGDVDGHLYLSMEYVDGEDLSASLRRVGRFPEDKAIALARQICGGLAAAHDRGVVHRDLKPANIMLDAAGQVRLMDFGLAAIGEVQDIRSGTPAYMAPEQIDGTEATRRSDLYALGLVLYELFTGRRAFTATTIADLVRQKMSGEVTRPTEIVAQLDPAIERAIMRCLEHDPARRPASALAVAASLPGGDPLAAAVAAGETPSPAMVAAAGGIAPAALSPLPGLAWLIAGLVLIAMTGVAGPRISLLAIVPIEKSRPVLEDKARDLAARFGYADRPADIASGYRYDTAFLTWAKERRDGHPRFASLSSGRPGVVRFWFRSSPRPMIPLSATGSVTMGDKGNDEPDPPFTVAGMVGLELDGQARLLSFRAQPPLAVETGDVTAFDWGVIFAAAGLDRTRFTDVEPVTMPLTPVDDRRAWTGTLPELPETALRIEAAAYRGRPTMFSIITPWTEHAATSVAESASGDLPVGVILLTVLGGTGLLARRSLRTGRADRSSARRLASTFVVGTLALWVVSTSHLSSVGAELKRFGPVLGDALFGGALAYVLYVALEPFVRRHWPRALITWSRFVSGRLGDPLVGRDLLIGTTLGVVAFSAQMWSSRLLTWMSGREPAPAEAHLAALLGWRDVVATIGWQALTSALSALALTLLLALIRRVVRRDWALVVIVAAPVVIAVAVGLLVSGSSPGSAPIAARIFAGSMLIAAGVAVILTIIRLGLVATAVMMFVIGVMGDFPVTFDATEIGAPPTWFAAAIIAGLAIAGYRLARGTQPLFGAARAE